MGNGGDATHPLPPRVQKMPLIHVIMIEFVAALFGFPGLGWLLAGRAAVGAALLFIGPVVAWALVPVLTAPFADTIFEPYGMYVLVVWLLATTFLSTLVLAVYVWFKRAVMEAHAQQSSGPAVRPALPVSVRPSE